MSSCQDRPCPHSTSLQTGTGTTAAQLGMEKATSHLPVSDLLCLVCAHMHPVRCPASLLVCALPSLYVLFPPHPAEILNLTVVNGPQVPAAVGSPLELTCVATLDPDTPEVHLNWTGPPDSSPFTVRQMKEGANVTSVLSVEMVRVGDNGTFTCKATVVEREDMLNRVASVDVAVISELMNKESV